MPLGLINVTNTTVTNVTQIANFSNLPEFFINVNNMIYQGWLYFIILWVLFVILYKVFQSSRDQPLNNLMYAGAACSILSILLRGIYVVQLGVIKGLLTDKQMWIFPLITIFLALGIWAIKD